MSTRLTVALSVTAIVMQAVLVGVIPFALNDWFLTTPDAGGWACGAQTLADTGQFSDGHTAGLGYNFNICWTKEFYPALQYGLAALVLLTGVAAHQLVPLLLIVVLAGLSMTMWAVGWRITGSHKIALLTGLGTSITPIVLRSEILTPQNLIGYWLVAVLLLVISQLIASKQPWWWLGIIVLAGLLGYAHSLSFSVATLAGTMWFYGWYLPNWKWRLSLGLLGIAGGIALWFIDFLPVSLHDAVGQFTSGAFAGYDHPLYDHPAFLGYGLVVVAAVGILFGRLPDRSSKGLLFAWFIVPLLLGHMSLVGWVLMPDRFIAYIWFSIILFGAIGVDYLLKRQSKAIGWMLLVVMWGAQFVHTVIYIKDDIDGWSNRFQPHVEFVEALQWLNQQPDQGILVGIMAAANREITFAPLWYDGPIASYPWYNLNHRNLKSFKAKSSLYQTVFADPASPEYLRVQAFYTIIAKPKSDQAKPAALQYNLAYLIMPKGSQADDIWQQAQPEHFTQLYENTAYRIFSLR